jgi:nicotinamide riboside kinase
MRIYLTGTHSSGKTTLARYVSQRYNIPMLTEVARAVLVENEIPISRLRADIGLVNDYQREVISRQIRIEKEKLGSFVSDRAFDGLAYAAEHSTITEEMFNSPSFKEYIDWIKGGTIFFVRPNKNLLIDDGVRETPTWDSVVRIDGMIKMLLEIFGVSYLPIETGSMQERAKIIDFVVSKLKENK